MNKQNSSATVEMDLVRVFPLDDRDVVIAGFPKSGTNWFQVMISNLWDDWTTTRNERKQVPHLAGADTHQGYLGYGACIACEPPRLMKFHPSREFMPERWPEHGKVVHITRNPMDVCVSMYHHFRRSNTGIPDSSPLVVKDWDTHIDRFLSGQVVYGPYIDNIVSWQTFDHPNLLKITYEETRRDTKRVLRRIAEFLERDFADERLDVVVERTEFSRMRQNDDLKRQMNIPLVDSNSATDFMRKGAVGDWQNELSPEAIRRLQDELVRPLEEAGVRLQYV